MRVHDETGGQKQKKKKINKRKKRMKKVLLPALKSIYFMKCVQLFVFLFFLL